MCKIVQITSYRYSCKKYDNWRKSQNFHRTPHFYGYLPVFRKSPETPRSHPDVQVATPFEPCWGGRWGARVPRRQLGQLQGMCSPRSTEPLRRQSWGFQVEFFVVFWGFSDCLLSQLSCKRCVFCINAKTTNCASKLNFLHRSNQQHFWARITGESAEIGSDKTHIRNLLK